jgi:integrase
MTDAKLWIDQTAPTILSGYDPLTPFETADYREAIRLLQASTSQISNSKSQISLLSIVRDHLANTTPAQAAQPTADAVATYLSDKQSAGLRPSTLAMVRYKLAKLTSAFGDRPLDTITTADLAALLKTCATEANNRNDHIRKWRSFFNFAVAAGQLPRNPAAPLARAPLNEHRPGILTVPQARALLQAASVHHRGELLPFIVFGLFAGIRTAEIERLEWSMVDRAAGHIYIPASIGKTRNDRYVTIRPPLDAWLDHCARKAGPVVRIAFSTRIRYMRAIRNKAKLGPLPNNCLRHSFGSYLLALLEDAPAVAYQMGNSPEILARHYRKLVTAADAAAFFDLKPAACLRRQKTGIGRYRQASAGIATKAPKA